MYRVSRVMAAYKPHKQAVHFPVMTGNMLPENSMSDKLCLVTGGGTGLGKAMTRTFAGLGANVVIASRNVKVLEETSGMLNEELGREAVTYRQLDLKQTSKIGEFFDSLDRTPDIIINNAAGNFISPTERLSQNAFDTIIDIVLKGTVSVTLEAGKRMIKEGKRGTFLAITVPYAEYGSAYTVPSACAKAGVDNLTKSLSAEWGQYGIRLNAIAPGPIYTEGAFSRLDPTGEGFKLMLEKIPTGRLGEQIEIANLASYLCSDYASWISGEIVTLDGGQIRQMSGMFDDVRKIPNSQWDAMEKLIRTKSKSS